MHRSLVLALLLAPAVASAVPTTVQHQGRLFDDTGAPLTGSHTLGFTLYDADAAGTNVWTESVSADFDEGYFTATLGETTALDSTLLDGADYWLAISVDGGTELTDRLQLNSVPYAVRASAADTATTADSATTADTATNVSGGVVDASELQIGSTTVIDSTGAFSGTLPAHNHDGTEITSGTISVDRLPVGGSDTQVAAGDHDHGFGQITGVVDITQLPVGGGSTDVSAGDHDHAFPVITGVAAITQLPVGSTSTDVARGDHSHTAADVGAVAIGDPLQPGDSAAVCDGSDTTEYGTIRWTGDALEVCTNQPGWHTLWAFVDGTTPGSAGTSCLDLLGRGATTDGLYWIDPTSSGSPYQVYCDQTTDGGGWTLVLRLSDFDGGIDWTVDGAGWTGSTAYNAVTDISLTDTAGAVDHRSLAYSELPGNNVMIRESLQADLHGVYTVDDVLASRPLRSITSPAIPGTGGAACSANFVNMGATPNSATYNDLTFATDEGPDTEPARIGIRNGCSGDSEYLQLGYQRASHGDQEVYSQGNNWGNLQSVYVLVR